MKKLTCVEYTPQGMIKIEDDPGKVAAFMNPLLPQAQELAMSCIRELFENYDFDIIGDNNALFGFSCNDEHYTTSSV